MLKRMFTVLLLVTGITIIGLGAFNEAKANECANFNIQLLPEVTRYGGDVFEYHYIEGSGT